LTRLCRDRVPNEAADQRLVEADISSWSHAYTMRQTRNGDGDRDLHRTRLKHGSQINYMETSLTVSSTLT